MSDTIRSFETPTLMALLASALTTGIVGGVFFGFSTFVMPALARLPASQGVLAMQSINVTVFEPLFMGCFLGSAVACLAWLARVPFVWSAPGTGWIAAGALLYVVGSFGVTMAFNVPRNEALAALDANAAEAIAWWPRFVREWTWGNHVRCVASLASAACFVLAALRLVRP